MSLVTQGLISSNGPPRHNVVERLCRKPVLAFHSCDARRMNKGVAKLSNILIVRTS